MLFKDDFIAVRNLASDSPVDVVGFSRHTAPKTSVTLQQAKFIQAFLILERMA